ISERLKFYSYASDAHGGDLFVATPEALMQKAMPYKTFIQLSRIFQVGDEFLERPHDALIRLGYEAAPQVEDVGQFSIRGGIVDIFSPHMDTPIRIELFGDQIESLRFFNPVDQRSLGEVRHLKITPAREVIYPEDHTELLQRTRLQLKDQKSNPEADEILRSLSLRNHFSGIDFMLPFFYEQLSSSLDYFSSGINVWINDLNATMRTADEAWRSLKDESQTPSQSGIRATLESFYTPFEELPFPSDSRQIRFSEIEILENSKLEFKKILYSTQPVQELLTAGSSPQSDIWLETTKLKLERWRDDGYRIFLACRNRMSQERLALLLQRFNFHSAQIIASDDKSTVGKDVDWLSWLHDQDSDRRLFHLVPRFLPESLRLPEDRILFLRDEDFFGRKMRLHEFTATEEFQNQAKRLSFGDLSPGDLVVHIKHGIGKYEGLKIMAINGAESEFIQLSYKDGDKLFIPVYRVGQLQKYSSMTHTALLDKLGGTSWEKTKIKVKSHLRDIAHELLNLYAKRSELFRPAFELNSSESE
ncbi:MAG TPA: CarD family transcriptional regulator, partial [Pseudobdellovibrionaceae bacterium]|nr:CarD family transcriptional regulator [Pseudobdellovibrionaceae bacterium]